MISTPRALDISLTASGKSVPLRTLRAAGEAGIDQRLTLGVGTGRRAVSNGGGERGRSPRKDGSAIELHFMLLGWRPTPGKRLDGHNSLKSYHVSRRN